MKGIVKLAFALFSMNLLNSSLLLAQAPPLFPASSATLTDFKYGWKQESDGSLSYIVQIKPESASEIALKGGEAKLAIPDFVRGVAKNVVIRIGLGDVERDPSEEILRSRAIPGNATNGLQSGNIMALNGTRSNDPVLIDRQKTDNNPLQTTLSSRSTNEDLAMQVPSLNSNSNSFPPITSRPTNGFDTSSSALSQTNPYRSNVNSASNSTVFPRNDALSNSSSSFVGPVLPANTPGNSVIVNGVPPTSVQANGPLQDRYADSRYNVGNGSNYTNPQGTYVSSNTPLGNGFGNTNNLNVPTTPYNNTYGTNSQYSTGPNSLGNNLGAHNGYGANNYSNSNFATTGYNNSSVLPNSSQQQYGTQTGITPYANGVNGTQGYNNNPLSNANYAGNGNQPGYNVATNGNYPNNGGYGTQNPPLLANNSVGVGPRQIGQGFQKPVYGVGTPISSSSVENSELPSSVARASQREQLTQFFCLVLFMSNVYLIYLLNRLFQRYRLLQQSARSSTVSSLL